MTQSAHLVFVHETGTPDRALLGGKAASLVLLTRLGARVPPAFVLTTQAYHHWAENQDEDALLSWIRGGIASLEAQSGRKLGSVRDPLVVSVRSGAPVSMPGMMDTVLNIGLGKIGVDAPSFLHDARRRFLLQFAETVADLSRERIEAIDVSAPDLDQLEEQLSSEAAAHEFVWPRDAESEIVAAAKAVFASWDSSRAKLYRRMRKIDNDLGTAVTIQVMVFGNFDQQSGSGVAFTRDPTTGVRGLCGEFLVGGQGEEVVAGRETAASIAKWAEHFPDQYSELLAIADRLEQDSGQVQEIEFTIERGTLFILQCRRALLTSEAAARVAVDMVAEGRLSQDSALAYATEHGFDPKTIMSRKEVKDDAAPFATGLAVGGGVASGRLALSELASARFAQNGEPIIFATTETSPSLLPVMQRSAGLVTMRGGSTSHAAVVAREIGVSCVVGLGGIVSDGRMTAGSETLEEGDWITIDGNSGALYVGDVAAQGGATAGPGNALLSWASNQ